MTAFLSDQDVAQRVLEHIANKTTDAGDEVWREPVQNYRCPKRFEDEIHTVLRRYPMPFCPPPPCPKPVLTLPEPPLAFHWWWCVATTA